MRALEKWIWLSQEKYPNEQTTFFHHDACSDERKKEIGHYTVAEFQRMYTLDKKVKSAKLRFSGDTVYDLWLNGELVATGPAGVGGDYFLGNQTCRAQYYASEVVVYPECRELNFYARVRMMPVLLNEYSKGHGGFMLTAHLTYEDGSVDILTTDRSWKVRRNGCYTSPFQYDGSIVPDAYDFAEEIQNLWHTETAPIPVRTEHILNCGGEWMRVSAGERKEYVVEHEKVYAAYLALQVQTKGKITVSVQCFEQDVVNSSENFGFVSDAEYRGLDLHSVGGYRIVIDNQSEEEAGVRVGAIATCYPAGECAVTETSDTQLNLVLAQCRQALQYCRQLMHLDSPKHSEPLACTGDYYIETLMTAWSFGDMRLASFDVRRTAELLRYQDGQMFHTTYSLIWVQMAYEVYLYTGDASVLEDCVEGLIALLRRFETYIGENGMVETPPNYMFVDWLEVDGMSLHHPPKNLGQGCMNMFYYGALQTAAKIFQTLSMKAMAGECSQKAEVLKEALNKNLYDSQKGLYKEGMETATSKEQLNGWLPQSNGKAYFRKHTNILAACFEVSEGDTARAILEKVMAEKELGECQPYFMHFLLEAVFRHGLREKYTLQILERWKKAAGVCKKGLQEGFILPKDYPFDLSHAWGGTPLYSLPKALLGFEMVEPAYKVIRVSPTLLGLQKAKVELPTPYGKLVCVMEEGKEPMWDIPKEVAVLTEK